MAIWDEGTNVLESSYAQYAQAQSAWLKYLVPTNRYGGVTFETYLNNGAYWNVLDGTTSQSPAIADGVTDNSAVFNNIASRVFAAGGGRIFVPPGRYIAKSVIAYPGVEWFGLDGSCIALPVSAVDWDRIFTTGAQEYSGAVDSLKRIAFRNLQFDGQRALRGPYSAGQQQGSHLVSIGGNVLTEGRAQLLIDNCDFIESTGDGLSVGPNVDYVITASTGRNCWRGIWTFYGGHSRGAIGVLKAQDTGSIDRLGFHVEVDVEGYGGSFTTEIYASVIDLGGLYAQITPNAFGSESIVAIGLLNSGDGTLLSGGSAKVQINGGKLTFGEQENDLNRVVNPSNMVLSNLEVEVSRKRIGSGGGAKTFTGLHVFPNASGLTDAQRLTCNNVKFTTHSSILPGDTVKAAYVEPSLLAQDFQLHLNDCEIVERYDVGPELGQGGKLRIKDTRNFAVLPWRAFATTAGGNYEFHVTIDNMEVKAGIAKWGHITNGTAGSTLTHRNCILDTSVALIDQTTGFNGMTFEGERVILTTTDPDGVAPGVLGDRRRVRTPTSGQPYEYVCTVSSSAATTWKVLTTVA